jgi:hypothetical protein
VIRLGVCGYAGLHREDCSWRSLPSKGRGGGAADRHLRDLEGNSGGRLGRGKSEGRGELWVI